MTSLHDWLQLVLKTVLVLFAALCVGVGAWFIHGWVTPSPKAPTALDAGR